MPWDFINNITQVNQGSNSFTLTEPNSVLAGDLEIVAIALRGNVRPTIPSGWTLVASTPNGNTSTTVNSTMSALIVAYTIRGGSAPTLVFSRTGGDVCHARLTAYRGNRKGSVFGSALSLQAAAHTTIGSLGSLTTDSTEELVCLYFAGGDDTASVTSFHTTTSGYTASSGTNETVDPRSFHFQERFDGNTTVGADVQMAMGDVLIPVSGTTLTDVKCVAAASTRFSIAAVRFRSQPDRDVTDTLLLGDRTFDDLLLSRLYRDGVLVADAERRVQDSKISITDKLLFWDVGSTYVPPSWTLYQRDATDKVFVTDGDTPGRWDRSLFRVEGELLGDKAMRGAERVARVMDYLFLRDTAVASGYVGAGPELFTRAATDYLLTPDYRLFEIHAQQTDRLLLRDSAQRLIEMRPQDALLLGDAIARAVQADRLIIDKVLLKEAAALDKSLDRSFLDGLFLYDTAETTAAKLNVIAAVDKIFLRDSSASTKALVRDFIDKLFLRDTATADKSGLITRDAVDKLLMGENVRKEIALSILEKLYLTTPPAHREDSIFFNQPLEVQDRISRFMLKLVMDALLLKESSAIDYFAASGGLAIRSALDNILLGEARQLLRTYETTDRLFLKESQSLIKSMERASLDRLLLADARASDLLKGFIDKIMLADARFSDFDRAFVEKLLLADRTLKVMEKLVRDGVLLGDSGFQDRTGLALRAAIDFLLIADAVSVQTFAGPGLYLRTALDSLLLRDDVMRERVRQFVDKMFLRDTALREKFANVSAQDGLYLKETDVRQLLKLMREGLLIGDAAHAVKVTAREAVDKFMLADRRLSERGITISDGLLLRDIITRALQIIARENLLVPDSVAAQWFPVVVEFVSYIRLAIKRLVGMETLVGPLIPRRILIARWIGRLTTIKRARA